MVTVSFFLKIFCLLCLFLLNLWDAKMRDRFVDALLIVFSDLKVRASVHSRERVYSEDGFDLVLSGWEGSSIGCME